MDNRISYPNEKQNAFYAFVFVIESRGMEIFKTRLEHYIARMTRVKLSPSERTGDDKRQRKPLDIAL